MNKIIVVTGASSGIGKCIAQMLSAENIVYGLSRRTLDNAAFISLNADINDEKSINSAIEKIFNENGKIDVLVNCAGNGMAGSVEDMTTDDIKYQMQTNFFGTINTIKAVLPYMREQKFGKIISIGSVAARISIPFQSVYSASKAALAAVSNALRLELKDFNIKCTMIETGGHKNQLYRVSSFCQSCKNIRIQS